MQHWWDIRDWSRRDGPLLLLALVLTGFVAYLVLANYRAAVQLRTGLHEQAERETRQRAMALAGFIAQHREIAADLASSADLAAYFENQAMGMSLEYGLRQNLLIIGERFDRLRERKRLDGRPVLARLQFSDASGAVLIQSPAAIRDETGSRAGPVPEDDGGSIDLSPGRTHILLRLPVHHRGRHAGQVVAWIPLERLAEIAGVGSDADGDRTSLSGLGLGIDDPDTAIPDGRQLVLHAPVADTPFTVTTRRPAEPYLGAEPWHALVAMAAISLVLLGGAVALIVSRMRSRRLGALVTELQVREQVASQRNRESLDRERSARERAELERSRLGYAIEQAAESIIITDTEGVIEYVNPAFCAATGWSREEAIGRTPNLLKSGVHETTLYAGMWQELLAGQPWHGRLVNRRKDGSLFHVDATISPVRDGDGVIRRFVSLTRDVTRLVQMEEQLRQAQKLESIGQLAAGIAHEINTPIQFVGDNLRFLADACRDIDRTVAVLRTAARTEDESARRTAIAMANAAEEAADLDYLLAEVPKALAQSQDGVARVAQIVLAMKAFSHPGGQDIAPTDLNRAIESTATVSRNEWKYVATLDLDLDPTLPPVPLLLGDFNQAMLNLIVNAAHAIGDRKRPEGALGRIRVSTQQEGNEAVVRIEDDGCGIPESVRPRIFEPFFTTKEVGRGTGQGLTIARTVIVKKLHGHISFESTPGIGTTFIIRLPLDPPTAMPTSALPSAVPAASSP